MIFEPFYVFDTTLGNTLIDPALDSCQIQSIAFRISSHVSTLSFCSLWSSWLVVYVFQFILGLDSALRPNTLLIRVRERLMEILHISIRFLSDSALFVDTRYYSNLYMHERDY
jgi:ABC-type uncharacterized transport system permease subunit